MLSVNHVESLEAQTSEEHRIALDSDHRPCDVELVFQSRPADAPQAHSRRRRKRQNFCRKWKVKPEVIGDMQCQGLFDLPVGVSIQGQWEHLQQCAAAASFAVPAFESETASD